MDISGIRKGIRKITDYTERTYKDDNGKTGIVNDPRNVALLIFMLSVLK